MGKKEGLIQNVVEESFWENHLLTYRPCSLNIASKNWLI